MSALLLAVDGCMHGDSREGELVAEVDGRRLCLGHWKAEGRPWPRRVAAPGEALDVENKTRERMTARGGTDRHMVRNGRT